MREFKDENKNRLIKYFANNDEVVYGEYHDMDNLNEFGSIPILLV